MCASVSSCRRSCKKLWWRVAPRTVTVTIGRRTCQRAYTHADPSLLVLGRLEHASAPPICTYLACLVHHLRPVLVNRIQALNHSLAETLHGAGAKGVGTPPPPNVRINDCHQYPLPLHALPRHDARVSPDLLGRTSASNTGNPRPC